MSCLNKSLNFLLNIAYLRRCVEKICVFHTFALYLLFTSNCDHRSKEISHHTDYRRKCAPDHFNSSNAPKWVYYQRKFPNTHFLSPFCTPKLRSTKSTEAHSTSSSLFQRRQQSCVIQQVILWVKYRFSDFWGARWGDGVLSVKRF